MFVNSLPMHNICLSIYEGETTHFPFPFDLQDCHGLNLTLQI